MTDWFEILLLVTLIAGYVFLFIQGRITRQSQLRLEQAFGETKRALAELQATASTIPQPAAPLAMPMVEIPDLRPELELLRDDLAQDRQVSAETRAAILRSEGQLAALAEVLEALPEKMRTDAPLAAPAAAPELSPEEIARKFLLEEGFSRVHLVGSDLKDGGVRFLVRALRGEEVRSGYVMVKDGAVLDAGLKVPTAIFP